MNLINNGSKTVPTPATTINGKYQSKELARNNLEGAQNLSIQLGGVIGEVTEERLERLREADSIIRDEINKSGLYNSVWQVFGVLLTSVQSVGVMGDKRTYSNPIVLRAVTSEDGMTADWARLPYDVLETISTRIVNEVKNVNRVVYDITSKPPGTIEWE